MAKRFYERGAEPRVTNREAIVALERNYQITSGSDEVMQNLNVALLYLVRAVEGLSVDLDRLDTYVRRPGAY